MLSAFKVHWLTYTQRIGLNITVRASYQNVSMQTCEFIWIIRYRESQNCLVFMIHHSVPDLGLEGMQARNQEDKKEQEH